ncbi:MAG TPA: phosphoribosyltransferase family protein [Deltaproteobacteria bacterium]|nr:phosphoribosyltransferase family protein [Deltaproteobacteria bacterium]
MKKTFPEAIRLSWEDVENLLWETFVSLRSSGFDPDVIIGVARGGLVPARILTDYLQKKYICTFQMGHWAEGKTLSEKPTIVFPLPEVDLSDKRVLVVDDVSDVGGTMEGVVQYLSSRVGDIKTAVLVNKADSRFKTDYCPRIMKQWRWVLFPWSKHEDLVAFTEKVLQLTGGLPIEDIVRILEEALSVDVMTQEIEKVLLDMKLAGEVAEGKNRIWTLI